jgi:hypothetical protein
MGHLDSQEGFGFGLEGQILFSTHCTHSSEQELKSLSQVKTKFKDLPVQLA